MENEDFDKWFIKLEERIRGCVISMSTDAEWALMKISVCTLCLKDPKTNPKTGEVIVQELPKYKKMTLNPMIDHTIKAIKDYSIDLYNETQEMFEELKLSNDFRTKAAHCIFRSDANKLDKSFITIVDITIDGVLTFEKLTLIEINQHMVNFRSVLYKFGELADKLNAQVYAKLGYEIVK